MINMSADGDKKPSLKVQIIGILIVVLLVLFCNSAKGQQDITLGWNPETNPDVAGYILHYGDSSGNYNINFDAGTNTIVTVPNLALTANLYFAVTSYDTNGVESAPSTEVYLSPTMSDFLKGHVSFTNGVDYLSFANGNLFGYYGWVGFPWFYHLDLGYEYLYDANDGQGSVYLYDYASGTWWYTNPRIFPVLYDFSLNQWLFYYPDTKNPGRYTSEPRMFFNYGTKQKFTK
jgi:hypothetical protein